MDNERGLTLIELMIGIFAVFGMAVLCFAIVFAIKFCN